MLFMFYGSFWSCSDLLEGFLILGRRRPSPAGRLGASQATPNTPVGRRGYRPSERTRTAPSGTMRVAQAKSSGAAARKPCFQCLLRACEVPIVSGMGVMCSSSGNERFGHSVFCSD